MEPSIKLVQPTQPTQPTQPASVRLVGMDPSLRNWGIALASYVLGGDSISLEQVGVIQPAQSKNKLVRINSQDIDCATQLYEGARQACQGAQAIFVEVPHGSQSSRAMASYGICCGVLGALRAEGYPFFEVNATEVKLAGAGNKKAKKEEMIAWARAQHPEITWANAAAMVEHQADAVAAIYAGVRSNAFKQMLPLLAARKQPT